MAKGGRQTYKGAERKLYLGEWLARLDRKPVDLARAVGVTEPYISELISGRKDNPSPLLLLAISEWLGITVNDLYIAPPSASELAAVESVLNPSQMATFGRVLDGIKRRGRR
jgi:transcriptional regulator with XRE-family HTH domain